MLCEKKHGIPIDPIFPRTMPGINKKRIATSITGFQILLRKYCLMRTTVVPLICSTFKTMNK